MAEEKNPVKGRWVPGVSGNPKGRPPGPSMRMKLFNKVTPEEREELLRIAIADARNGDTDMMKFLLNKFLPANPKDDVTSVDMSHCKTVEERSKCVMEALDNHQVTALDAKNLLDAIAIHRENIDMAHCERLEAAMVAHGIPV